MKKFFVSKSDKNKVDFITSAINKIKPDNVYILVNKDRVGVYKDINAIKLPLKQLNKTTEWITFINTLTPNSLLVIDNVLEFIFFGDGKKKYLKDVSQSINNIIVTDVVPFYTEPYEIFYPFWFLGKGILGYNSYQSFKANNLEEAEDGKINYAHSFEVLNEKIKDFYIQDYPHFYTNFTFKIFSSSEKENEDYERAKKEYIESYSNPIKLYCSLSEYINLVDTRYNSVKEALEDNKDKKIVLVNNSNSFINKHKKKLGNVDFLTFHDNVEKFKKYDCIIFMQLPIVKAYTIFYILSLDKKFIQIQMDNNNLESFFSKKIYNNELRKEIDTLFYNENV